MTENDDKELLSTDFNVVVNEAFTFITCQMRTHLERETPDIVK